MKLLHYIVKLDKQELFRVFHSMLWVLSLLLRNSGHLIGGWLVSPADASLLGWIYQGSKICYLGPVQPLHLERQVKFWQCPFFISISSLFWSKVVLLQVYHHPEFVVAMGECVCMYFFVYSRNVAHPQWSSLLSPLNDILRKNGFIEQDMQTDFFLCCYFSLLDSSSLGLMNVSPSDRSFFSYFGLWV